MSFAGASDQAAGSLQVLLFIDVPGGDGNVTLGQSIVVRSIPRAFRCVKRLPRVQGCLIAPPVGGYLIRGGLWTRGRRCIVGLNVRHGGGIEAADA